MTADHAEGSYGRLTATRITAEMSERSVICLPVGSLEQHGPHLPLNTDAVIAERFAATLAAYVRDRHDLWVVPTVPYGLSPEHAWAAGTVTLDIALYTQLIETLVAEYVRATPARAILIVNGHGGNKGVLEALVHQLQRSHEVATCVVNPGSLAAAHLESNDEVPEVHAGVRETSLMLALAPDHVHMARLPDQSFSEADRREEIQRRVLGRGVTWPWSSDDPAISSHGVIGGDPRQASATYGRTLLGAALRACEDILERLAPPTSHEPADAGRDHDTHG